jgi:GT2 family glycosyltransferase
MKRQGFRMAYCDAATVWHKEGLTMGRRSPFQDYLVVRNTLYLVHRFFRGFTPLALLYSVYRCFLPKLLRGEWARSAAIARAYRDFVREALRERRIDATPTLNVGLGSWSQRKAL